MELDILVYRSTMEIKKVEVFPSLLFRVNMMLPILERIEMETYLIDLHETTTETHDTAHDFNHQRELIEDMPNYNKFKTGCITAAKEFVKAQQLNISTDNPIFGAWSNLHDIGTHHGWHNHPRCTVSGTFYIRFAEDAEPIQFQRPGLLERMHHGSGKGPFGALDMKVHPRENEMLVWSSELLHMVDTQREWGLKRLSLSWNVDYNR